MNVIRLAVRLAVGGGREAVVRLAVTSAGVGLGVCLLLLAAVTFPAIKAHEAREAWTYTTSHNDRPGQDETTTDPLTLSASTSLATSSTRTSPFTLWAPTLTPFGTRTRNSTLISLSLFRRSLWLR